MSDKRIAVFPGSFDPVTIGHEHIVQRSVILFDEIIIALGINAQKQYMFSLEERMDWLNKVFSKYDNVCVKSYEGLTIDFCEAQNAKYILRGLRNTIDFEYERSIALMNKALNPNIETICIPSSNEHSAINSTIVRDIIRNNGDASSFLPAEVKIA